MYRPRPRKRRAFSLRLTPEQDRMIIAIARAKRWTRSRTLREMIVFSHSHQDQIQVVENA